MKHKAQRLASFVTALGLAMACGGSSNDDGAGGTGGGNVDAGGTGGTGGVTGGTGGATGGTGGVTGGTGGVPTGGTGGVATGGTDGGGQKCCGPGAPCGCPPSPGGGAGGCYSACAGDVCKFDYPTDGCWKDFDCGDRTCVGVNVCPCGQLCGQPDAPGKCEPSGGCCTQDSECGNPSLRRCVSGVCQDVAGPGECWLESDCSAGENCLGELLCPCGKPCHTTEHTGKCACCKQPSDCGDNFGLTCAEGRCKDRTITTGCWNDAMCAQGKTCVNANVCPCGAVCLVPDQPGTCQ